MIILSIFKIAIIYIYIILMTVQVWKKEHYSHELFDIWLLVVYINISFKKENKNNTYPVNCTLYTVHCTLYTIHCIIEIYNWQCVIIDHVIIVHHTVWWLVYYIE